MVGFRGRVVHTLMRRYVFMEICINMTTNELIEKIFSTEPGTIDEEELIEKLAIKIGKTITAIKSAITSCRRSSNTVQKFQSCLSRRLRLGGPSQRR